MTIDPGLIEQIRLALRNDDRGLAWEILNRHLPRGNPLTRIVRRHLRDIAFVRGKTRPGRAAKDSSYTPRWVRASRRVVGPGRPCKGCRSTLDHRDALVQRNCFWSMEQRKRVRKSWAKHPPGHPARYARMQAAWNARRKNKDERIVAANPRAVQLFGRAEAIRQFRERERAGSAGTRRVRLRPQQRPEAGNAQSDAQ